MSYVTHFPTQGRPASQRPAAPSCVEETDSPPNSRNHRSTGTMSSGLGALGTAKCRSPGRIQSINHLSPCEIEQASAPLVRDAQGLLLHVSLCHRTAWSLLFRTSSFQFADCAQRQQEDRGSRGESGSSNFLAKES